MTVLSSEQRKLLSDVVVQAREVVEAACLQRITALGVAIDKAPEVLNEGERAVRVGLRARARQLGSTEALVTEAAFEHWHRMLFARFLADNQLLVDDQFGQPLSMDEVAEYAAESGETDMWEVAARFAAAMLPGIFVQGDPVLAMRLPVETRQELERQLDRLPSAVITAEDSLGWVYQYWQAKRKDDVNRSERKIGGADLAPVTQLFTEQYMVRFLLQNSLGAWWAARRPDSPLIYEWEYLRRHEDGSPAVGSCDGWPSSVAQVTVMDPCCGSGHFLVSAFDMLWRMRAEEEGLDPATAQDAVLRDNLYGLELDPRCTQIAIFALAVEAWKVGGYRALPLPNVACCGIPTRAPVSDWLHLAGGDPQIEAGLTRLHTLFANADTLGSLIDPVRAAEEAGLESVDWHGLAPLVRAALVRERRGHAADLAASVFGQAADGIARASDYLSQTYTLTATNPPYLTSKSQAPILKRHLQAHFNAEANDLATAMLTRCVRLLQPGGTAALVLPEGWLFLKAYEAMRSEILTQTRISTVVKLGAGAFGSISGEVVRGTLYVARKMTPAPDDRYLAMDVSSRGRGPSDRAQALSVDAHHMVSQAMQRARPEKEILLTDSDTGSRLGDFAVSLQGLSTADTNRFVRRFWEVREGSPWSRLQGAPLALGPVGGMENVFRWDSGRGDLSRSRGAAIRGQSAWGSSGVLVGRMGQLAVSRYFGDAFDDSTAVLLPKRQRDLPAIWAYCESGLFQEAVRTYDTSIKVTNGNLLKVQFDSDHWRSVAEARYPQGLPIPHTADPTQWLFGGTVVIANSALQVAVLRLLGFVWPDQKPDGLDAMVDADGIVCIPALGGESTAEERLRAVLAEAFGVQWTQATLNALLVAAGGKPGTAGLEKWVKDGFFRDHCKVFGNRPFIWQIWDGRLDGFSALVNYHKLDRKLLERLTYDYLGSWWIGRLNDEVRQQIPGAEVRLLAAEALKGKLELILEGEPPYDIYVRWKSLAEQPMGWEPDLDDGVRMNIRPFVEAGILRAKPNIKWDKDRGKNPDGTERINDLHFTLAEKRAARGGVTS